MKNNYKHLKTKSPTTGHFSSGVNNIFKRSASHALRSSFRLPTKNKRTSSQFHALNLDQLPPSIPSKALRILQIDLPPTVDKLAMNEIFSDHPLQTKIATIRRRSVWANATASESLNFVGFFIQLF